MCSGSNFQIGGCADESLFLCRSTLHMGAFKSTVLVCNLLGVRNTTDRVTEEEIRLMIQESARDGDVQEVERIFNLGDRDLESIMTPRGGGGHIAWQDAKMTEQPCGQG